MQIHFSLQTALIVAAASAWLMFIVLLCLTLLRRDRAGVAGLGWDKIVQLAGGAAFLTTFLWTVTKDSESLNKARQQEASKQFSEAAKSLGDAQLGTRVSSVYFLGQLAKTRPEFSDTAVTLVMSLLPKTRARSGAEEGLRYPDINLDAQAAIDVLNRRDSEQDRHQLDLQRRTIIGGDFRGGKNTTGFANADFQSSILHRADFRGANLAAAKFSGADLSDWNSYGWKEKSGWKDTTADTVEWQQWEKFRYVARFEYANLKGASFKGALIDGAIFCGADLADADFSDAHISRADFRGARNVSASSFKNVCLDQTALFDDPAIQNAQTKTCRDKVVRPVVNMMSKPDCDPAKVDGDLITQEAAAPPRTDRP